MDAMETLALDMQALDQAADKEALWFPGGDLALSRFHSRQLALQIEARMEGLPSLAHASAPT